MKKLMLSLCALCLAGAVSAQVSKWPLSEKTQRLLQQPVSMGQKMEGRDVQTAPDRKANGRPDSVLVQSSYEWDGYYTLNWFSNDGQDLSNDGFCGEDQIRWVYGTGGLVSWSGTSEIGYRFATGDGSFYDLNGDYPRYGVPYAVGATVVRAPSSSRLHDGVYDTMPLYFKIYNSTQVAEQQAWASYSQYGPTNELVDVVYPTDPEKYMAVTDTAWITAGCRMQTQNGVTKGYPQGTWLTREFKDVDGSKPLGADFCVSFMFPVDWDAEGDSLLESTWNAYPTIMIQENEAFVISEEPHSVYLVYDFEKQAMWNPTEDKKRYEGLVADEEKQPNDRYAIVPMDAWYFEKGDPRNCVGEPDLWLYYTEWSALQSDNKADRYVQLSPIPATEYVNFRSFTAMSRIEIYSLGGQLVKKLDVSGDTYTLNITDLNSGMYVARIYSEKGISSKKFIVR